MNIRYFNINGRRRRVGTNLASFADFSVTPGESADVMAVTKQPNISLYCLDNIAKRAVFVEVPPGVDLARSAFVNQAQYEWAKRLIVMPFDVFFRASYDLPRRNSPILIHTIGRSCSTLLSHAFNQIEGVVSLSEPDVITQFVCLSRGAGDELHVRHLLDSAVRWLFKDVRPEHEVRCAVKLRNHALQAMDFVHRSFLSAVSLFLYRDALSWVESCYRIMQRAGFDKPRSVNEYVAWLCRLLQRDVTHLKACLQPRCELVSGCEQMTLWWLAGIETYLEKHQQGLPVLAVRHRDLQSPRGDVLAKIFSYCNLPTSKANDALQAYARDSQEGTIMARDKNAQGSGKLRHEERAAVAAILSRHPVLRDPDPVLAGTLSV